MAYIGKPKVCRICGVPGHQAINCYTRRKNIITRKRFIQRGAKARLKPFGKTANKWLKFRQEYLDNHPPDDSGFYHCIYCVEMGLSSFLTRRQVTLDHWHSRTRRPELKFDDSNIVFCCAWHNSDKGSKSGKEYLRILRKRVAAGGKARPY